MKTSHQSGFPDATPPSRATDLLDSEDFGWIEGLGFRSRRHSDDLYAGQHRSSQMGGCTEFADHRPYYPGDSLRQLDWRLLAKSNRHYIKRFEDERTVSTLIVIDRSGSMDFGISTPTKFNHALRTAACLARLLLGHRDPVGMATWDSAGDGLIVKPRSTPSHFEALFEEISRLRPDGDTLLATLVKHLIPLFPNRMRIILLTDGFMKNTSIETFLQNLTVRGHEVIFGHVLAPEELEFNFQEGTRFEDLERGHVYRDIDPAIYRESYLERFNAFLEEVQSLCTRLGCGYIRLASHQSAGASLAAFLRRWNAGNFAPVLGPDQKRPTVKTAEEKKGRK